MSALWADLARSRARAEKQRQKARKKAAIRRGKAGRARRAARTLRNWWLAVSEVDELGGPPDMGAGHGPATDPRGLVDAGEAPDNHFPTGAPPARSLADQSPEERAYNRNLYGLTYRERYGDQVGICVTHCLTPGQRRRGVRCPGCFQEVEIRPMGGSDVEPGPTRADRFAAWVGGWVGAFIDAMMFPFRVGRAHHEAMVRDILREALTNGLQVEALTDILNVLEDIGQGMHGIKDHIERLGGGC